MTDTTRFAAAVKRYRDEMNAAAALRDESLSRDGLMERKSALAQQARTTLLAARVTLPAAISIDELLDDMRASTAD